MQALNLSKTAKNKHGPVRSTALFLLFDFELATGCSTLPATF